MPRETEHPSGNIIVFNPKRHMFYLKDNPKTRFESVTKFTNRFFPKFDFYGISEKYADKYGLDVNEVRKEWERKKNEAIRLGNACHDYVHKLLTDATASIPEPRDEKEELYFKTVRNRLKNLFMNCEVVGSEYMIASLKYKIAGIVDLLLRSNNTLIIADWKSNEKIEFESPFGSALEPIDHLDDCNGNKYALQVSIYKKIIESEGYFPWAKSYKLFLFHISPDGIIDREIFGYDDEIDSMIERKKRWI